MSFTKGCFVGQELVCRIDTRGHVNRFLRRVHGDSDIGAAASAPSSCVDDRVVGTLTSAAGSDALAMVRREIEPPDRRCRVRWATARSPGRVEAL